jgi:hypothetical protein
MKQILDIILKLEEERKNLTNIRNWWNVGLIKAWSIINTSK